jgi:quinol monooxygenase YgiN
MAALEEHQKSEPYQALMKRAAEEQLLAGPPDIKILQPVGGFPARG